MTDNKCESVQLALMALHDGEASPLRVEEIQAHIRECEACREETESLRTLEEMFTSHQRASVQADIWPMIDERLESEPTSASSRWRILLLFGIPLVGYKGLLLLLQTGPNLWSKLVPLLVVIAVFIYLRTNPFKINSELTLSGELSS